MIDCVCVHGRVHLLNTNHQLCQYQSNNQILNGAQPNQNGSAWAQPNQNGGAGDTDEFESLSFAFYFKKSGISYECMC